MKISAIKQQIKRPDRYSVYIDEKYSFSLNETQLLESGLTIGQELNPAKIQELQYTSKLGKLYDKTLNLLSFRLRSEWELRDYLKRNKQDQTTIDQVLKLLSKSGYVDDERFARRWVENRRLLKPISRRKLWAELKQKHIANEIIDQVLTNDETDELKILEQLVQRKAKRYPDKQKLMQYLARQGFNYDDIRKVIENI